MILVDTGPPVAAVNRRDARHDECGDLLEQRAGQLLVSPYVVAEVCWMVAGAGAEPNIIDAVTAGELRQINLTAEDLRRTAELLHRYRDLHAGAGLSAADASTIAVAERLAIHGIATRRGRRRLRVARVRSIIGRATLAACSTRWDGSVQPAVLRGCPRARQRCSGGRGPR